MGLEMGLDLGWKNGLVMWASHVIFRSTRTHFCLTQTACSVVVDKQTVGTNLMTAVAKKRKQTFASFGIWIFGGCMNGPLKLTPICFVATSDLSGSHSGNFTSCHDFSMLFEAQRLKVILQFPKILLLQTVYRIKLQKVGTSTFLNVEDTLSLN